MKKCVIYDQQEFDDLPTKLIQAICDKAKKGYGFKFISRETGEEYNRVAIVGLLFSAIRKVLEENKGD